MPLLSIIKVSGDSLAPALHHGDYILAGGGGWMLRRLQPGDILVFTHPHYGRMLKRLQSISPDGQELFVVGDAPESVDSRTFGAIPRRSVTARALMTFRQK